MFERVLVANFGVATAAAGNVPARGTARRVAIGVVAQAEGGDLLVVVE